MVDIKSIVDVLKRDGVHLQRLSDGDLLARISGDNWSPGKPYEIMVLVRHIDEDACMIAGLDKTPSNKNLSQLCFALADHGYQFLEHDRYEENGEIRHYCWRTKR